MINKDGQIEVRVGCTFNDGENTYCAIMKHSCGLCCFNNDLYDNLCIVLACSDDERLDGIGVHFIREGGEK